MKEDAKEIVELAVGYTKQIVEALTPLAKQAYEIGLLTLQIDAAQVLVVSILMVIFGGIVMWKIVQDIKRAIKLAELPENKSRYSTCSFTDHLFAEGVFHFIGGAIVSFGGVAGLIGMLKIWLWVKLFSPELWLAHQAVEKILK